MISFTFSTEHYASEKVADRVGKQCYEKNIKSRRAMLWARVFWGAGT
jgi:hypothetical protein